MNPGVRKVNVGWERHLFSGNVCTDGSQRFRCCSLSLPACLQLNFKSSAILNQLVAAFTNSGILGHAQAGWVIASKRVERGGESGMVRSVHIAVISQSIPSSV